jgi:hypothetical protein
MKVSKRGSVPLLPLVLSPTLATMPLLKDVSLDHLADAVCVITGGSSGIGLAIAERLLSLKSQVRGVVVCSRSQAGVDKAVKQL